MSSLRGKSARAKRSGDGREGRSKAKLERAASIPGRSTGEGLQAKAWSTTSFEKLKSSKDDNNCSSSTSPETDPGASNVFPFFTEEDRGQDDGEDGVGSSRSGEGGGHGRHLSGKASPKGAAAKAQPRPAATTARLEHRNPIYHAANVNAESAVASLFLGDDCEGSTSPAVNGSNPMFRRKFSDNGRPRPRPKAENPDADADANAEGNTAAGSGSGNGGDGAAKDNNAKEKGKEKGKDGQPRKKKKEKAMYEHVGRMNVGAFLNSGEGDEDGGKHGGVGHGAFRMDTFARNEGEDGGKAHFKFVFTLDGVEVPSEGEDAKKLRPMLDAIHERSTGNLRVRVNDGREITATATTTSPSVVDVALTHIGVVLFYPKTVSKGHHLYTLSLNGRTLFSVLA